MGKPLCTADFPVPPRLYLCIMRIDVITVLPELLESPLSHSIMKRAQSKGLLEVHIHNLRQWAVNEYGQVDDYQYGGGAGMVMMCEPLARALDQMKTERNYDEVIFLTPDGKNLQQKTANLLSLKENLIMICGHYKGIDERIREHYITMEISIGDYVLTGGELPALVVIDSIVRLVPGVLKKEEATRNESFSEEKLLEHPQYTRPADFRGWKVPDVLLSGDPKKVDEWRYQQAIQRTSQRRPDLMNSETD